MNKEKELRAEIVCKNICKTYGEGATKVVALRDVSLTINKGELRLLMGPSGSGKTTLISIITGILMQDSGVCLMQGVDVNRLPDQERTKYRGQHIGFVFQLFNLIPSLTVGENITVPLILNGVGSKEAMERAGELLKEFGMGDKINTYPRNLSGGQQQRVAIARAMAHSPELIVCDEPTSYLDHENGMKTMELLKTMVVDKGVTLVVVTHDPRIMKFADKIDYVEDGTIVDKPADK